MAARVWASSVTISSETDHQAVGQRTEPLPSAEIDGAGTVYVVWQDCRFESKCSANDLVMSTSADGQTWFAAQRIPTDAVGSGVDHSSPVWASIRPPPALPLTSRWHTTTFPTLNCTTATCQLQVGFVSSLNGGSTWSAPTTLTVAAMNLTWLAKPPMAIWLVTTLHLLHRRQSVPRLCCRVRSHWQPVE